AGIDLVNAQAYCTPRSDLRKPTPHVVPFTGTTALSEEIRNAAIGQGARSDLGARWPVRRPAPCSARRRSDQGRTPEGDPAREIPPYYVDDLSAFFLSVHRGKKSIVLDLKSEQRLAAFQDLVRH